MPKVLFVGLPKRHGIGLKVKRPAICTEWLNRGTGSTVADCLPLFLRENMGAMHWGLVNGKTQTHLNWGHLPGQPDPKIWQHDLFHGNHQPYDPAEIKLFRAALRRPPKTHVVTSEGNSLAR